jgi:hypothetical protein
MNLQWTLVKPDLDKMPKSFILIIATKDTDQWSYDLILLDKEVEEDDDDCWSLSSGDGEEYFIEDYEDVVADLYLIINKQV